MFFSRVVHIIEKIHGRKASGHLVMFEVNNPNFALFRPTDNRIPRMKIPREFCPPEFFVRSDDFKDFLFLAEIAKWELVSFPIGKVTSSKPGKGRSISMDL